LEELNSAVSTTPASIGTGCCEIGQVAPVLAEFRIILGGLV